MTEQCLFLDFGVVGTRWRNISQFGLFHELYGYEWALSRIELALSGVTVTGSTFQVVSPVLVLLVGAWAKLFFLFKGDDWVQEACLRWHLLPQHDVLLKLGVSRLIIQFRLACVLVPEAGVDVLADRDGTLPDSTTSHL